MGPPTRVSVVVCAHDDARFEWLTLAVESVASQRPAPHEVVVVIDHNSSLLERARARFSRARVVPNAEARGLSGARNTGIRNATGDVIAFLDDDAEARPGWLAGLVAAYDRPSVLGVGGSILPRWEVPAPSWFPDEYLWVVGCGYRGLPVRSAEVRNLIGCNMSFRRSVFEAVGGFRQSVGRGRGLPLGCEETELCIRAAGAIPGGTIVYDPVATVDHRVPASRGRISYFLVRCYSEGISKAYVVNFVGSGAGLSSERRYLVRTLSAGMARHLLSVRTTAAAGLARASMILAGLIAFGAGYLWGLLRFRIEHPVATVPPVSQLEE
jgi:GT2 family glycosyltransferase